jgi:hypothetical protein
MFFPSPIPIGYPAHVENNKRRLVAASGLEIHFVQAPTAINRWVWIALKPLGTRRQRLGLCTRQAYLLGSDPKGLLPQGTRVMMEISALIHRNSPLGDKSSQRRAYAQ